MGSTITEKILARAAGAGEVHAGDIIEAKVDLVLANDITAPLAIDEFEKAGFEKVFDPDKIALMPDHFTPNKDIKAAGQVKKMREFARKHEIVHYFEVGRVGIEHVLLPDSGMVAPGDVVIGADCHTCTYGALGAFGTGVGSTDLAAAMAWGDVWLRVPETFKFVYSGTPSPWVTGKDLILYTIGLIGVDGALYQAMEFTGEAIERPLHGRPLHHVQHGDRGRRQERHRGLRRDDHAVPGGAAGRQPRAHGRPGFASDPDAEYENVLEIDAADVPLTVSKPHLPCNTAAAADCADIKIDQVVIGSCTNGRIDDLHQAADILEGKKVHPDVRCIIIPGTQDVCLEAIADGPCRRSSRPAAPSARPPAAPCLGGHMGVLAEGERAVSTTNRNFVGRMGHPGAEVYLAGPYVAAACAVAGHIATPEEVGAGREAPDDLRGHRPQFGRDVDTDVIIPARYLNTKTRTSWPLTRWRTSTPASSPGCSRATSSWPPRTSAAASSREHAPLAIKVLRGVLVIAASFARIFYRNAFNTGLPIVVCPAAAEEAQKGDRLKVDLATGVVENLTQGKTYEAEPFPPFMQELVDRGGLLEYVKSRVGGQGE